MNLARSVDYPLLELHVTRDAYSENLLKTGIQIMTLLPVSVVSIITRFQVIPTCNLSIHGCIFYFWNI